MQPRFSLSVVMIFINCLLVIALLVFATSSFTPPTPFGISQVNAWDVGHVLGFALFSIAFFFGVKTLFHSPKGLDDELAIASILVTGILFGSLIELVQHLQVSDHRANVLDVGLDALGASVVLLMVDAQLAHEKALNLQRLKKQADFAVKTPLLAGSVLLLALGALGDLILPKVLKDFILRFV